MSTLMTVGTKADITRCVQVSNVNHNEMSRMK